MYQNVTAMRSRRAIPCDTLIQTPLSDRGAAVRRRGFRQVWGVDQPQRWNTSQSGECRKNYRMLLANILADVDNERRRLGSDEGGAGYNADAVLCYCRL